MHDLVKMLSLCANHLRLDGNTNHSKSLTKQLYFRVKNHHQTKIKNINKTEKSTYRSASFLLNNKLTYTIIQ